MSSILRTTGATRSIVPFSTNNYYEPVSLSFCDLLKDAQGYHQTVTFFIQPFNFLKIIMFRNTVQSVTVLKIITQNCIIWITSPNHDSRGRNPTQDHHKTALCCYLSCNFLATNLSLDYTFL